MKPGDLVKPTEKLIYHHSFCDAPCFDMGIVLKILPTTKRPCLVVLTNFNTVYHVLKEDCLTC